MESEVVHSPSETPGGISSWGNAISSLEESQQRRGEIFLNMVLQNSKAENLPMATAILGSCRQPRARRGRGLWAIKNTLQFQRAAVPVTTSTFGHLSSPLQPRLRWDLGTRQTHSPGSGRQQHPRREGFGWGDPPPAQKGCGCSSRVVLSWWNFGTVTCRIPGHPLAPAAKAGSHPAGVTKGASPQFLLLI